MTVSWGWSPHKWDSSFYERDPRAVLCPPTTWDYTPQEVCSPEVGSCWSRLRHFLTSDLQHPGLGEASVLHKPSRYMYLVTAVQTDWDILTATAVSEASSFLLAIRIEQWNNLLHDLWVQRQEDSSGQVAVSTLGSIEPLWYVGHKILTDRVHHHKVNGVFIKNELGIKCYFGIYLHGVPK